MKRLTDLIAAFVLSIAGILLPLSQANVFAAEGDPKETKITITDGIEYTEGGTGHMEFDDHQLDSGDTVSYPSSASGKHSLKFFFSFEYEIMGYTVDEVTVNGVSVDFTHGTGGSYAIEVGEEANYNIGISAAHTGPNKYTIIWSNPGGDFWDEDMKIVNGRAEILAVYNRDGQLVPESEYTQEGSKHGLIDEFGWALVEEGYKVVFKFTPFYGYQLISVKANEQTLEAQEDTNQYTFTMPSTHVHFAADFAKTADVVIAGSEKVSGGAIKLGSGELDAGTVQLDVNDVELDTNKITDFEKVADGAQISDYLDIDLFNVFYKGKSDSEDVWSSQIHELEKEATITLKLADDIDVSRVVIVHNIDDGDEFEIIKIDSYDAEAHTITFKTKSFSNFAIALSAGAPNSGFATSEGASAVSTIASVLGISTIISAAAWAVIRFAKR